MKIDGRFWLTKEGQNFLGNGRIELLEQIAKTGSISASAKAMKMSYKAAWERVNQMNSLANVPIIQRAVGGKGGGGTTLTPHAYELIATFKSFERVHRQFMERFAEAGDDPERLARILGRAFLTTSARNQFSCKILSIEERGINASVKLRLQGGEEFWADITVKSIRNMGLVEGCDAYAIVKSSDAFISNSLPKENDRENALCGKIANVESMGENAEIAFVLEGGETLIGVMSKQEAMTLQQNSTAYATILKRNVILGL